MVQRKRLEPVTLQGRRLIFRNFAGAQGQYNAKGERTFNLVLEPDEAEAMSRDGWNVKQLKPRDPEEQPLYLLNVRVRYDKYPPRVVLITSKGKTPLPEDLIGILDTAEFDNIDLIVTPSFWDVNGKTGYKAYLKALYATLHEDELELKYMDTPDYPLPDSAIGAIQMSSEIVAIERDNGRPAIERGESRVPF